VWLSTLVLILTPASIAAADPPAGTSPPILVYNPLTGTKTAPAPPTSAKAGAPQPAPPMWQTHGFRHYTATYAKKAPVIDGVLDDAVWKEATVEERFYNVLSKPYAMPTTEPTSLQIAYDETTLYLAFRCRYSGPGERDNAMAPDEASLLQSEFIGITIDGQHDHNNAIQFRVGRTGARAEAAVTNNGQGVNNDWTTIWTSDVHTTQDEWIAEMAIPWSSAGVPSHDGPFTVGINILRAVPRATTRLVWSVAPPAPNVPQITFLGHLDIPGPNKPGETLYLQPYVAAGLHFNKLQSYAPLNDFTRTDGAGNVYGGVYARYRPYAGPLQIEATVNPDFTTVAPDQALTNLSRFEIAYPETRPFFAEDRGRFEFGTQNAQLFYSRRVGLRQADGLDPRQPFFRVPIFSGVKAIARTHSDDLAVMNVEVSNYDRSQKPVTFGDNMTVARYNHFFDGGHRVGNIFISRAGQVSDYKATGVDGAYTMLNQNLVLSGFLAGSATNRPINPQAQPAGKGTMGDVQAQWDSADFELGAEYLTIASGFDGQLGFMPQVGIRSFRANAGYTPLIHNDLVHDIAIRASIDRTRAQNDSLVFDHGNLQFQAVLLNTALLLAEFKPTTEGVLIPFTIANNRIRIAGGTYDGQLTHIALSSPPRRTLEAGVDYLEGDLYNGYQRVPSVRAGINVGHYYASGAYSLYFITPPAQIAHAGDQIVGHQLNASTTYSYTPLAKSTLFIRLNTLDTQALVQFVNSYTFGKLSTVAFTFSQSANTIDIFVSRPVTTALLSFAYGITPL
jgi:hypothetical protein